MAYKFIIGVVLSAGAAFVLFLTHYQDQDQPVKLYWFIPDGLRAEPDLFNIYQWAREGDLPNIKRMMDEGSFGFSIPVFPSHTPVNFATLLTGTKPSIHGVADGPMHTEGHSLDKVSVAGFSSLARKIPAIWSFFEEQGFNVGVISTPGSTPPELKNGTVVRGRWGNWGFDTPAINIEYVGDNSVRRSRGRASRLFFFGPQLTTYVDYTSSDWLPSTPSEFPPRVFTFEAYGVKYQAALIDDLFDGKTRYSKVAFAQEKGTELATLNEQQWSDWFPTEVKSGEFSLASHLRFHVIKLDGDRFFRIRVWFNSLNESLTEPPRIAAELTKALAPMMDFVDNYPPQLIHYPEDQETFLSEMAESFAWHTKLIPTFLQRYRPDVMIHNIYNPNQMLTSRWWLGSIDPQGLDFARISPGEKREKWEDVKDMYQKIDAMIGQILEAKGENSVIVLSSDHGAAPLRRRVHLNNLLAKNGYLKFRVDRTTGEPIIDWAKSKAIYLKMDGIYIHPQGLQGKWKRASGPAFERLREDITKLLFGLKDENGISPVSRIVKWEEASEELGLPSDRVGDLIVANVSGFGWSEEMSENFKIFSSPLESGYKQAILPGESKSMWTPFMIIGPGVKRGHFIKQPIHHEDQLPTILRTMSLKYDGPITGTVLDEIFDK